MLKFPKAYLEATVSMAERQKIQAQAKPIRGQMKHMAQLDDAGLFPTETTARIDMSAEVAGAGLCPECRKPMERSHANDIPVLRCLDCRIALPTPDAPEVVADADTVEPQVDNDVVRGLGGPT
jgi:hypothetical protein